MRVSGVRSSCDTCASRLLWPADQLLDALGRPVEAARQLGHLVAAFDLDARLQVARTERLHPRLQTLEPSA